jgi:hypothetical protein
LRECNRAGLAQRKRIDRFIFEYDITATIEAATQAEAEAKLLAEPALLDFSDPGCASRNSSPLSSQLLWKTVKVLCIRPVARGLTRAEQNAQAASATGQGSRRENE